jgi:hypothetical protein
MDSKPILIATRSPYGSIDEFTQNYVSDVPMPATLTMADGTSASLAIGTEARIEFTDHAMFVMFRGKYEALRYAGNLPIEPETGKSHELWMHSDVYELFIGPNSRVTGQYKEFQVAPDGRFIDISINPAEGKSNPHWRSGIQCLSYSDAPKKLWTAVMQIPWNCFDVDFRSDCEWNANLYRATGKFHGDELMAWSPTGYGERAFHRYTNFGRIIFEQ